MNKQKTIWIINQYASTPEAGIGGRSYYYASELAKKGYKVYLIAASYTHILRTPPQLESKYKIERVNGFDFVWLKMPKYPHAHSKKRIINWFLFSWKLKHLSNYIDEKPDVILYSSPSLIGFLGAKKLADKLGVRFVFEVRDIWPLSLEEIGGYSAKHPFIRFLQWIEDKAYRESDAVVSNLKYAIEHMAERGLDKDKFSWMPNGFSMDEVSKKAPLDASIQAQLPQDKFIVGYTGTIGLANCLEQFISAAALMTSYEDIAFVMVGGGKEKEKLEAFCKDKQLDNVYFIEPIKKAQIQSMLNLFDACFIGLTKDPLFRFGVSPNKLFDYLFSAKPIIYAIDSGKYRPVSSVGAGIEIEPENAEAIMQAVLDLYHSPKETLHEMGCRARQLALEEYEYSILTEKLERVLFVE